MTTPNFLIIMSDEHAPQYSSIYGHPLVQTPNMERLAQAGVTFENAYCNSPLCTPSRMSFMTGRYVHQIECWDNATPLRSDAVTWAHLLRSVGYDVVLSGKQHFSGHDQLHGFRAQLARDLHAERSHPIVSWDDGIRTASSPWPSIYDAGPGTTEEIEVDDLVQTRALEYLRDPARKDQPWALNVSFIAPHFPLIVPQRFWELYPLDQIDLPEIPPGHIDDQHQVYQRIRTMFGFPEFPEDLVRRARAAYYGLITYFDEKIGELIDTLAATNQLENTVIVHISDHGEMNGEHGMWRKSNFYEASSRIPLQIAWPGHIPAGERRPEVVSLVDVIATIVDIAEVEPITPLAGDSLLPLLQDQAVDWKNEAFAEYLAHGVDRPMAMLRQGRYKLNYSLDDPPELYDLKNDPNEFNNLGEHAGYQTVVEDLQARLLGFWDPVALNEKVRRSQRERLLIEATTGSEWRGLSHAVPPPEWKDR